jgi:hypothetical protein
LPALTRGNLHTPLPVALRFAVGRQLPPGESRARPSAPVPKGSLVSAHRAKHRKRRAHYRRPSKITVAAAGVSAVGTIAVASGVAFAATNAPAGRAATSREAAGTVASQPDSVADAAHQLAGQRADIRTAELDRLAVARREAARRAARRRAAARARRLAAEQAAQEAAAAQQRAERRAQRAADQQAAQQAAASSSGGSAAPSGSPQQIAMGMLGSYGWSTSQFGCLNSLWNAESGWNVTATNPTSGAYGIPQALPGSKMASAGADWQTDAATQIRWGLGYIQSLYSTPCGAWSHEEADGWY